MLTFVNLSDSELIAAGADASDFGLNESAHAITHILIPFCAHNPDSSVWWYAAVAPLEQESDRKGK